MPGKKLHIVHTESSTGWGGQEIRILNEAAGLKSRGHRITLICCPGAKISPEARMIGLEVVELPIYKKRPSCLLGLYRWLKKQVASGNEIDIINTHSSTDSWLVAISVAILKQKIAVVRTRHVSTPVHPTFINRWLYGKAASHVVTTGEKVKQQLIDQNGISEHQLSSIPTGVDIPHFQGSLTSTVISNLKDSLEISAGTLVIGCIAMMRDWKGHRYLVDALDLLKDLDLHLLLVGDGELRGQLEAQVTNRKLSKKVSFVGYQTDILPYLGLTDIHCLPSYENEGVSQAIIQTSAAAIPNIACDIGGNAEVVENGETGILVKAKCADSIASAIVKLYKSPALRQNMGQRAAQHATINFSLETMLDKMEQCFLDHSA